MYLKLPQEYKRKYYIIKNEEWYSLKYALSKGPSKTGLIENSDMSDDIDICFMQVNKEIIFSLKYELLLY